MIGDGLTDVQHQATYSQLGYSAGLLDKQTQMSTASIESEIFMAVANGQYKQATDLFDPLAPDLMEQSGNWDVLNYRNTFNETPMPYSTFIQENTTKILYGIPDNGMGSENP